MRVFLAGLSSFTNEFFQAVDIIRNAGNEPRLYALESFYYANEKTLRLLPVISDFLLDSGAFTFMTNGKSRKFDKYLEDYAAFINKYDIKHFFELDVDSITGYQTVLEMRRKLESLTGKQCIPVWHKSRGKKEFLKMCDEYKYVSIGGIVTKEIKPADYPVFSYLVKEAHQRGAKIHGLGFTSLLGVQKYHFDTVDSTSWVAGQKFGFLYKFNGKSLEKIDKPPNYKMRNYRQVVVNNLTEWIKFQQYAENLL